MKVAYADPPYLGCCARYEHFHPDGLCWDDAETHQLLILRLLADFPDGWALSCASTSLRVLLPMCPADVRVAAWVKPFAAFKVGVNPAYAWEPVIWRGGRTRRSRTEATVRDWFAHEITLKRGLTGAKPEAFVTWLLALLGVAHDDELVDLFPGTGVVGRVLADWRAYRDLLPLEVIR